MLERLADLLTSKWVRVRGDSMSPTLRDGQWARVSRRVYRNGVPSRFDVVRFEAPVEGLRFDVKRIVGLPDELVELRAGVLFVDGAEVPFEITGGGDAAWGPDVDEYVVLGDNREASTDSRRYGVVRRDAIVGIVEVRSRTRR